MRDLYLLTKSDIVPVRLTSGSQTFHVDSVFSCGMVKLTGIFVAASRIAVPFFSDSVQPMVCMGERPVTPGVSIVGSGVASDPELPAESFKTIEEQKSVFWYLKQRCSEVSNHFLNKKLTI